MDFKSQQCSLKRFNSCPDLVTTKKCICKNEENDIKDSSSYILKPQQSITSHNKVINTISENDSGNYSFVPVQNTLDSTVHNQTSCEPNLVALISSPYSHPLFSSALQPLPIPHSFQLRDCTKTSATLKPTPLVSSTDSSFGMPYGEVPFYTTLSPPELLDRHLQLGSDIYMKELNIPLTSTNSTDWTHFGGHPPADEMSILRGQILLLHNQLLFERHKREIHAERNRRLLGKAKRAWMLEEQNAAMKDQLQLQEKEIQDLVKEVNRLSKMYNKWKDVKNHQNEEINKKLRTLTDENTNLEHKKIRTYEQLIEQKQENELLRSELRKVCSQYSEIQLELASAFRRANRCQKLEEDAKRLSKEVILLSEMNQHYRERIENMQPLPTVSAEDAMWRQSAISEISVLKQKLESKTILLEAAKERILQLESTIAHNNSIMTEQKQLLELTKSCHIDILQAKESKISALQKIWRQQEMYILELQQKLQLSEKKISTLGNKKSLSQDTIINQSVTAEVSRNADETDGTYSKVNNTALNETDYLISSEMLTTPECNSLNASNFINQCQVTYKSLENCVNESLENNGTSQTQSLPTNSNGCTLEEIK